jgi:hypothetical protein
VLLDGTMAIQEFDLGVRQSSMASIGLENDSAATACCLYERSQQGGTSGERPLIHGIVQNLFASAATRIGGGSPCFIAWFSLLWQISLLEESAMGIQQ